VSNPVFVTLGEATVGFQWGVQRTDLVLVLMSQRSVEASRAQGHAGAERERRGRPRRPLGPRPPPTRPSRRQVLSYARNEGIFHWHLARPDEHHLGDDGWNALAYGVPDVLPSQTLAGNVAPPAARQAFTALLNKATSGAAAAPAEDAPAAPRTDVKSPPDAPADEARPTRWKTRSGRTATALTPRSQARPLAQRLREAGPRLRIHHEGGQTVMMNCTPMQIMRNPISRVSATMPVTPSSRLRRSAPRSTPQQVSATIRMPVRDPGEVEHSFQPGRVLA